MPNNFGISMPVSRAELAMVFSYLLIDPYNPDIVYEVPYDDVKEDDPFRNYIGFISQYNLPLTPSEDSFFPNEFITRAELARILAGFTDKKGNSVITDVPSDYWAKDYINKVISASWMSCDSEGKFNPDRSIKRAELAKIIVTVLNRDTSEITAMDNLPVFEDVPVNYWAYPYIMDAVTEK